MRKIVKAEVLNTAFSENASRACWPGRSLSRRRAPRVSSKDVFRTSAYYYLNAINRARAMQTIAPMTRTLLAEETSLATPCEMSQPANFGVLSALKSRLLKSFSSNCTDIIVYRLPISLCL